MCLKCSVFFTPRGCENKVVYHLSAIFFYQKENTKKNRSEHTMNQSWNHNVDWALEEISRERDIRLAVTTCAINTIVKMLVMKLFAYTNEKNIVPSFLFPWIDRFSCNRVYPRNWPVVVEIEANEIIKPK